MSKLKKMWTLFKMIWNSKKREQLEELIPLIEQSKHNIVLFSNEDDANSSNTGMWIPTEQFDINFATIGRNVIKNNIINSIGQQQYEENIEQFDYDIAMAYKEIDYQTVKNDALESEFMYYREINNPNGMKGPQLLHLWQRVCDMKKKLEQFN